MALYHTLDPVCFSGHPLGGVVPQHPHSSGVPGVGSSEPCGAPSLAQEACLYALYLDLWCQYEGIYRSNIVYTLYIWNFGVNMKVYTYSYYIVYMLYIWTFGVNMKVYIVIILYVCVCVCVCVLGGGGGGSGFLS